jgi:hypothetical protein
MVVVPEYGVRQQLDSLMERHSLPTIESAL